MKLLEFIETLFCILENKDHIDLFRYIEKVGKKAKLEEKNIRQALRLMKKVQNAGLSAGKDPMGIVGFVIYLSLPKSDENTKKRIITQAVIADAAGISESVQLEM